MVGTVGRGGDANFKKVPAQGEHWRWRGWNPAHRGMSGREKYSDNMRPLSVKKASKGGTAEENS